MSKKQQPEHSTKNSPPDQITPTETLEAAIERQIGPLIPNTQRQQVVERVTQVIMTNEQFSGPIAHPRHLEKYEEILPGSADRIVTMAENQQNHNIAMESTIVGAEVSDQRLGMILGFLVLAGLVGCAVWAGSNGNNILAGLLLSTAVVGSVVAFIKGRNGN